MNIIYEYAEGSVCFTHKNCVDHLDQNPDERICNRVLQRSRTTLWNV